LECHEDGLKHNQIAALLTGHWSQRPRLGRLARPWCHASIPPAHVSAYSGSTSQ